MLKSQMIKTLTDSIEKDGDSNIGVRAMIEMFDPGRLHEYDAREQIVRSIVRAKRDLKAPMSSNFFADIWPKALAALKREE